MKKLFVLLVLLSLSGAAFASHTDEDEPTIVEGAAYGVNFLINGVEFAAKTYCPDLQVGDKVVFLEGDPNGNCTEAMVVSERTSEACKMLCQFPL
jgi:hypothetical protein